MQFSPRGSCWTNDESLLRAFGDRAPHRDIDRHQDRADVRNVVHERLRESELCRSTIYFPAAALRRGDSIARRRRTAFANLTRDLRLTEECAAALERELQRGDAEAGNVLRFGERQRGRGARGLAHREAR